MQKKLLYALVGLLPALALFVPPALSQTTTGDTTRLQSLLDKVYQTMDEHYYLPVSRDIYEKFLKNYPAAKLKKLNEKARKTPDFVHLGAGLLVNQLKSPSDKFTNFVPPEKTQEFKNKVYAVTFDLGITGNKTKEGFLISHVQKHAPAFKQGVRSGDLILEISRKKISKLRDEEIAKLLTPEKNTVTPLKLRRGGNQEIYNVSLTSESYFKETVEQLTSPAPNTLAIKLTHFNQLTGEDFGDTLQNFGVQNIHALILDLRGNDGGPPLAAREILGYFLKPNDFLFAIARKRQKPVMLASPPKEALYQGPVFILVNNRTGSAAEMFSGVLQSKKIAKLYGVKTAGATYLKSIYDFEDKSMIFMITSLTFFPDRSVFPKDGLIPDITLAESDDAMQKVLKDLPR